MEYFWLPLETLLYYRVKYNSLKTLQLLYHSVITKLSTLILKFFKHLHVNILLYLLMFCFYVSHGSATKFLKVGKKYYIYFVHNLLPFPPVKEFSKSVNI